MPQARTQRPEGSARAEWNVRPNPRVEEGIDRKESTGSVLYFIAFGE
jgi:hypothetical protein